MPKFFVKNNQINENKITINGEDVNHIINVLRMKEKDEIEICDLENGVNYLSEIIDYNRDTVFCNIKEKLNDTSEANVDITLFQGIPKFDKMELIIQKNTEVGVKRIVPVNMIRCIAKIKDKSKIDRWNKIAAIAAKQSMRDIIPKIEDPISFDELCKNASDFDIIFLAYEKEANNTLKSELKNININDKKQKIGIIIGPEGGITNQEVEKISKLPNVKTITLGKRILRTETAGIVISSNIIYELDN